MNLDRAGGHRGRIRAAYGNLSVRYDRRWRRYLDESIEATLEEARFGVEDRLLDVGCGTGLLLERVIRRTPGVRAMGIDLLPQMLREAARREVWTGRPRLAAGDVADLPVADGSFDLVLSTSALHHWPRPAAALAEIARVTRPGGQVLLTDWCRDVHIFKPLALYLSLRDASVERIHSRREVVALFEGAGLRITGTTVYRIASIWGMITIAAERPAG